MEQEYLNLWEETKSNIKTVINEVKEKEVKLKEDMHKYEKKIKSLREDIAYADREDKIYMREELNRIRDSYDEIAKEADEKNTELYISSPYFCKINTEEDAFYISKYKKDFNNDIFLFTDPIAKLRFYDIDESEKINGHNHKVNEKIDYIIEESELKQLTHYKKEVTYTFDGENTTVIKGEMPKVKKAISKDTNRKIGMQEIIDRMKLEQDEVMRAPEIGVTLISGGAGTGKTNMAIHRLRYLINEYGSMFKEENMALMCYNVALKEYLSTVIGDLNLNKVHVYSFDKWAYSNVRNYSNIKFINYGMNIKEETEEAYKTAMYAEVLRGYVEGLKEDLENDIVSSKILKFHIPDNYMFNDIITIQDIFELRNEIIENLDYSMDKEKEVESVDAELTSILKKYYVTEIDFKEKNFKLNATNILYKVYISEELKKQFPNVFFFYKPLFQHKANKYELYSIAYLLSLIAGDFNNDLKLFDHIAVDEVQDFLPIQIKTLKNISGYSMTLTGDVNQKIFNSGLEKWDGLGVEVDNLYYLKEVHRSTVQTVNFANSIIGNTDKIINENTGKKPVLSIIKKLSTTISSVIELINEIKKEDEDASIVVLYPDSKKIYYVNTALNEGGINSYIALKDEWDFTKDVAVTNYHQVKGLEFDYVIILGLTEFEEYSYSDKEKLMYTILTRAKERVYMYSSDEVEMFKNIDKDLYEIKE